MRRALVVLVALAAIGAVYPYTSDSTTSNDVTASEVVFGRLAGGSSVGDASTNATASLVGTLLATTSDVLYLNNTNVTGAYYARIETYDATGLANLAAATVGLDNGTQTPQSVVALGAIVQSTGASVRLEPGSVNRIYLTRTVLLVGGATTLSMDVYVSDAENESSYTKLRAALSIV